MRVLAAISILAAFACPVPASAADTITVAYTGVKQAAGRWKLIELRVVGAPHDVTLPKALRGGYFVNGQCDVDGRRRLTRCRVEDTAPSTRLAHTFGLKLIRKVRVDLGSLDAGAIDSVEISINVHDESLPVDRRMRCLAPLCVTTPPPPPPGSPDTSPPTSVPRTPPIAVPEIIIPPIEPIRPPERAPRQRQRRTISIPRR